LWGKANVLLGCPKINATMASMPSKSFLNVYLDEVRRVRALNAGSGETSYYPALSALLNAAGDQLRPRVFCLHHVSGEAGIPDFGLFEHTQFRRDETRAWVATVTPERGVVEAKGASHGIEALLKSKQVREQYLPIYGLVLATSLWQFRLLDAGGAVVESFDLAANEAGFWALAAGPRPDALRDRFADFLQRCLLTRAPLARPSAVAFFLSVLCARGSGAACRAGKASGAGRVAPTPSSGVRSRPRRLGMSSKPRDRSLPSCCSARTWMPPTGPAPLRTGERTGETRRLLIGYM
jgi:hypothetical protein